MRLLPPLALLLASVTALAQGVLLPSQEDVAKAMEKARDAMAKVQGGAGEGTRADGNVSVPPKQAAPMQTPSTPNVNALPKPYAPAPDIAGIAEKYKDLGRALAREQQRDASRVDLLVLVSLSMPQEALDRIIDQAEKAGATLVFRGLKGDSMIRMTDEIQALIGKRNVNIAIHPPAFQRFRVTRVPAVVLARGEASNVMENGCAKADTFVKVSGDVSIDYALDHIERRSSAWAEEARKFRSKIVRGL